MNAVWHRNGGLESVHCHVKLFISVLRWCMVHCGWMVLDKSTCVYGTWSHNLRRTLLMISSRICWPEVLWKLHCTGCDDITRDHDVIKSSGVAASVRSPFCNYTKWAFRYFVVKILCNAPLKISGTLHFILSKTLSVILSIQSFFQSSHSFNPYVILLILRNASDFHSAFCRREGLCHHVVRACNIRMNVYPVMTQG